MCKLDQWSMKSKKCSYWKRWELLQFCRIQRILQRGQCGSDGQEWSAFNYGKIHEGTGCKAHSSNVYYRWKGLR